MTEEIWNGFLEMTAKVILLDWGALIALLPILVFIPVVIILVWQMVRLRRAAPAERGFAAVTPRTPAGIHMPGPSWSPIFAAIGSFLLLLGLVFGGPLLVVGAIAIALTLLMWGAEAIRIYDQEIASTTPPLPAVVHPGPPPGVHMPGPSYRPFLGAVGAFLLLLGLVFGGLLLIVGVVALVVTLVGWLVDARKEYVKTVEADRTGHLENIPAPETPSVMLWGLAIMVVVAVVLQMTVFGGAASEGASAAPSGAPPASGAPPPSGAPAPSGEAPPSAPAADVTLIAQGIAFTENAFSAPADQPFTLALDNRDAGTPHNVELKDAGGASVFQGEVFNGVATKAYDVPPLPAGGYTFLCTVHPTMSGTATLE